MTEIKPDMIVDARGMSCPMPVLKTKRAIEGLINGQLIEVIATDPGSKADISTLINRLGHEIVYIKENNGIFFFLIKKK